MSELTDLLLAMFEPAQALLFLGLAGVDYLQVRWFSRELETVASVGTEEQQAIADGGPTVEEADDV